MSAPFGAGGRFGAWCSGRCSGQCDVRGGGGAAEGGLRVLFSTAAAHDGSKINLVGMHSPPWTPASHTVQFASPEARCAMFYQCGDTHWSSVMTLQFHLLACAATSRLWIPHRMRSVCGVCNSGHRCRRWGPRHCTRSSFATPLQPPASPAHCTTCPQGHTSQHAARTAAP